MGRTAGSGDLLRILTLLILLILAPLLSAVASCNWVSLASNALTYRTTAAGALFETGPIKDFSKSETAKVRVTDRFPMVSAVAMIAPSPDWFAGAMNVNLKENGQWVPQKTVTLYAWDSGGDDGMTYKADDKDTNPKKPAMMAQTPHFIVNGNAVPVSTLTFNKE